MEKKRIYLSEIIRTNLKSWHFQFADNKYFTAMNRVFDEDFSNDFLNDND